MNPFMKTPLYNHTRDDSALMPCPECAATPAERELAEELQRARSKLVQYKDDARKERLAARAESMRDGEMMERTLIVRWLLESPAARTLTRTDLAVKIARGEHAQ